MDSPSIQHSAEQLRTDAEAHAIKRSDVWYEDGDIVLQAESTQFRVYSSTLRQSSLIFDDMFNKLQPTDDQGMLVEGCSVMQLPGSAEDWEYLLERLYRRKYHSVEKTEIPFPVVLAFLRLGSKYNIHELRAEAIEHLSRAFPTTLEEHDALHLTSLFTGPAEDAFAVVNLGRETGVLFMLPWAMFVICTICSFEDIHNGTTQSKPLTLEPNDQLACMTGWQTLTVKRGRDIINWLRWNTPIFPRCHSLGDCRKAKSDACTEILSHFGFMMSTWPAHWQRGMCQSCSSAAQMYYETSRKQIWDDLPSIFGLPGWEELVKTM